VLGSGNTYLGPTFVDAGVLELEPNGTLGGKIGSGPAIGAFVDAGAAVLLRGNVNVPGEPVTRSGSGIAKDGALRTQPFTSAGSATWGGDIALLGAACIGVDQQAGANQTLTLSGTVVGDSSSSLVKVGSAELLLTHANPDLDGPVTVTTGRLIIQDTLALGN